VFYAKPIPNSNVTALSLPKPFGDDFNPSAISIVNYPYANVRYVNYWIENGKYLTKNNVPVQTENAYMNLENPTEYTCMKQDTIDYHRHETHVKGLEDVRLGPNNTFFATSVGEYLKDMIVPLYGKYNHTNASYDDVVIMTSPKNRHCEKNWLFIPDSDRIIYDWCPFQVGKINNDTLEITNTYQTPHFFSKVRGSASPIIFENTLITLVHFIDVDHSTNARIYYHCFVKLDRTSYKPLQISLPFVFQSTSVEYCVCATMNGSTITCYVSFNDSKPSKVTFDYSNLQWNSI
jgi:hypothetical protein